MKDRLWAYFLGAWLITSFFYYLEIHGVSNYILRWLLALLGGGFTALLGVVVIVLISVRGDYYRI